MVINNYRQRSFRWLNVGSFCLCAVVMSTSTALATVQFSNAATLPPLITFDEIPPLTSNPVYNVGGTTVSFGSIFDGQVLGSDPNSLFDSSPNHPLQLDFSGPDVATMLDLSNPTYMDLGGAGFRTPIAILFADPVNRVEFKLGNLDGAGTTSIEAYDLQGNSLGLFKNVQGGFEPIALFDDANRNVIAGVSLFVEPGDMDWEGFAIDDVAFDFAEDNVIPEPAALAIWSILALLTTSISMVKSSRQPG